MNIAVMGPTGSGKSTFIKAMTKRDDIAVGSNLKPETNIVQGYPVEIGSESFVLIDTPGFDDQILTDKDVLGMIAAWLQNSRPAVKLTGIIYLYRINDNRLHGSSQRAFRMFNRLCGDDYSPNIVLATTFWDMVDENKGISREAELRGSEHWKRMIESGAGVERIHNYEECQHILEIFTRTEPKNLHVQEELAVTGASLSDVVDSIADSAEMKALKAQQTADREAAEALASRQAKAQEDKARVAARRERESARRVLEQQEALRNTQAEAHATA
ncbi:hypothetical protein LSUE1_G000042 [Lachnellula suecica]|uniref:G domain-containing protein n=1 Tax=Lachnellula suecica TaxID=602035 RepID=A0A8T9CLM8_9HELO|nr:hypothetical protein LSUE1_G000042 [Lachnellula suecica]